MSQQEMDRTAAEIVEGFGYFNSKELKQEAIAELRKNFKKEFGTEKNYVEKRVMEMMLENLLVAVVENRRIEVTKITFTSDKKANVEVQIKIPDIMGRGNEVIDKEIDDEIERIYTKRYGEIPTFEKIAKTSKSEQKKILDRVDSIMKEIINQKIKNKTLKYEISKENYTLIKVNGVWEIQ
jgi:hypothetical protein